MRTGLDATLLRLVEARPDWRQYLDPRELLLVERRLNGASLRQLAGEFGCTAPGVRVRLFGEGHGLVRRGGILWRLRKLPQ